MMAIVLIEGIDGSGKSTLADRVEEISKKRVIRFHKSQPQNDNALIEYFFPLLEMNDPECLYLLDRWHVGEIIYGPIYRGKSIFDNSSLDLVEKTLDDLGALKIIMSPSLRTVKTRLLSRGDDFILPEHVETVFDFYQAYGLQHNYAMLNTSTPDAYKNVLEVIKNVVNR